MSEVTRTKRDEALFDIFVTAIEGGTGYWATVEDYVWDVPDNTYHATLQQFDDWTGKPEGEPFRLDRAAILKGIETATLAWLDRPSGYHMDAIRSLYAGATDVDFDADTADLITQFALLGEVVYG